MRLSRLFRLELLHGPPWPLGAAGLRVLQPVLPQRPPQRITGEDGRAGHSRRFELVSVTSAIARPHKPTFC